MPNTFLLTVDRKESRILSETLLKTSNRKKDTAPLAQDAFSAVAAIISYLQHLFYILGQLILTNTVAQITTDNLKTWEKIWRMISSFLSH